MSDSYQAVYDAVRSRFPSVNVESAVRDALDFSWQKERICEMFREAANEAQLPSVLYRVELQPLPSGSWSCQYSGVYTTGRTPAEAVYNYNFYAWQGTPVPEVQP